MIVSRLVAHLRQQHWTGVFIELVIVVLGVFIGMQVSNWNQAQADARLGREYVKRLTRDLGGDLAEVRREIAYYDEVLKSTLETDRLLADAASDPRQLVVHAYRATEVSYSAPVRATWDQIVSSGHLGLLPPHAVESGLSQYYAFDTTQDTYRLAVASDYRKTVRRIIPMSMQVALRATCSDVRDAGGGISGFVEHCRFEADPAAITKVAADLRSEPAVAADLRYQYSFAVSASLNLGGVGNSIEAALAALRSGSGPDQGSAP
jgi:hypothetical protein